MRLRHEAAAQLMSAATRLAFGHDFEAVLTTKARRDRLDTAAIEQMAAQQLRAVMNAAWS